MRLFSPFTEGINYSMCCGWPSIGKCVAHPDKDWNGFIHFSTKLKPSRTKAIFFPLQEKPDAVLR